MPKAERVRFKIDVNGQPKEIFSVKIRSNDQLLILLPRSENMEIGGVNLPLQEDHISVHGSDRGSGTTIKRTTQQQDGTLLESAMFVPNVPKTWGRAVLSRVSLTLSPSRYDLPQREGEKIIHVAHHDPETSTLAFTIFAAHGHWRADKLKSIRTGVAYASCGRFTVGLMYSFLPIPSHPHGEDAVFTTSSMRVDKGPVAQIPINDKVWSPAAVHQVALHSLGSLAQKHVLRVNRRISEGGFEPINELHQTAAMFMAKPLDQFTEADKAAWFEYSRTAPAPYHYDLSTVGLPSFYTLP